MPSLWGTRNLKINIPFLSHIYIPLLHTPGWSSACTFQEKRLTGSKPTKMHRPRRTRSPVQSSSSRDHQSHLLLCHPDTQLIEVNGDRKLETSGAHRFQLICTADLQSSDNPEVSRRHLMATCNHLFFFHFIQSFQKTLNSHSRDGQAAGIPWGLGIGLTAQQQRVGRTTGRTSPCKGR